MGEELGNYVHQNRQTDSTVTFPVHTAPPGRVLGHTQTDSNITVHTDPPPVAFWDTDRQRERQFIWGRS